MSEDTEEWKVSVIEEMMDNEAGKAKAEEGAVTWDDYKGFKIRFLRDWSETDSAVLGLLGLMVGVS